MADPRPDRKRPLPLFLIAFLCLVVFGVLAFIIIPFIPVKPYFPPESPEMIAKRQSPENGFFALERAANSAQVVDRGESFDVSWTYMEEVLDSGWPDDPDKERELLGYFDRMAPAIAEAREGVEASYYLIPDLDRLTWEDWPALFGLQYIGRVLTAEGIRYQKNGSCDNALRNYLDTIRINATVVSEGDFWVHYSPNIADAALRRINQSLEQFTYPDSLRYGLSALDEAVQKLPPLRNVYVMQLLRWDNMLVAGYDEWEIPFFPRWTRGWGNEWLFRYVSRWFAVKRGRYYEEILEYAERPVHDILVAPPAFPEGYFEGNVLQGFDYEAARWGVWGGYLKGTQIAVALRLYRVEHGSYPDSLDVLVPEYLESLPLDSFSGRPFIYVKVGDDFRLYGVGRDMDDDGGVPEWSNGDQVIHLPRGELEVLSEAE